MSFQAVSSILELNSISLKPPCIQRSSANSVNGMSGYCTQHSLYGVYNKWCAGPCHRDSL